MVKDASLFSSMDTYTEKKIYVVDSFSIDITRHGEITYQHGQIVNMYHVPSLSENLLLVSQFTHTSKIIEF